MISVLILDGFSDSSLCSNNSIMSDLSDIYIPLLVGILRFNGVTCSVVNPSGLQYEYSLKGQTDKNLIYVPAFTCAGDSKVDLSFIYSDSTEIGSTSFRLASKIRKMREDRFKRVVFVNQLHENDTLKNYSPVVVDNIRFSIENHKCDNTKDLYNLALTTAVSICEHYGVVYRNIVDQ
ncbi:MAG: hypothetical protein J6S13_08815 [Clostridia bacterium]|nr:hypothetical protein [Clostridia bacterium]